MGWFDDLISLFNPDDNKEKAAQRGTTPKLGVNAGMGGYRSSSAPAREKKAIQERAANRTPNSGRPDSSWLEKFNGPSDNYDDVVPFRDRQTKQLWDSGAADRAAAEQLAQQQAQDNAVRDSAIQDIMSRLEQGFNGAPVDTGGIDRALAAQLAAINEARGQAKGNFNEYDSNIKSTYGSARNEVLGREDDIRADGKQYQNEMASIFNEGINDTKEEMGASADESAEMAKRLGLNAPDQGNSLLAQAQQEGVNRATADRNAQTSFARNFTENEVGRNEDYAGALLADQSKGRTDLNKMLQEIMGGLSEAESGYKANAEEQRLALQQQQYQRDWDTWLAERQADQGALDSINAGADQEYEYQQRMAEIQAEAMKNAPEATNPFGEGFTGLNNWASSSIPNADQLINNILGSVKNENASLNDPLSVLRGNPNLNPQDQAAMLEYLMRYNKLGTSKEQ